MTNQHPQPAFDLLNSLPVPAEDSFLINWYGRPEIDAERGDPIREHPGLWEYHELPDCLRELTVENYVSFYLVPALNLNAIAIGLGLENVEYEPEVFAGLVYHPTDVEVPVLCSSSQIDADKSMIISVSENPERAKKAITSTIETVDDLGLMDLPGELEDDINTEQVAELISSED